MWPLAEIVLGREGPDNSAVVSFRAVPAQFAGRNYIDLFNHVLDSEGAVLLGLYRKVRMFPNVCVHISRAFALVLVHQRLRQNSRMPCFSGRMPQGGLCV